ncbi:TrkH family potassium uptake protein [Weeksella virosa]|uniref:H(+)-transporting two-sector ATPase n=1 Tax=Weeksella virosa (strain ATCC 43766 / DSM 16922 / JCM 21250 / CCUG 30538 / CDC 9751 / IAM 14551 / NBRC 16016 / NCTC 11634 / CL345/78) TaxID=865938 RepID=F0NXB3_WEEVC|nr:potassium transporter TrkG [Weeksella virosa]ADX66887.1 H(+)-transporting two-sector ATPase [Weeksella virosa DSM 16922]VEH63386.1 Ktr system potassium uptake protein B [Weeksella virosa]
MYNKIAKITQNRVLGKVLSATYILAIVILIAMLGFGFPKIYYQYVNYFFITILLIGVVRTSFNNIIFAEKLITRVFIFDLISIAIVLYCIYRQLNEYSFFYVSKYLQLAIVLKLIREIAIPQLNIRKSKITPPQLFIISFLILVFGGSGLLMLPKATTQSISYLDALFTATSAVCVTGLTVVDTASTFTPFGHFLLMLLIQAGGLGILTFAGYIAYFFKGQSTYENQIALGNIANHDTISEVFDFVKRILLLTFGIELLGAIFIFFSVDNINFTFFDQLFFSIFHSVSAFCNAGFSTLPNNVMNDKLIFNYPFQSALIFLIFLGGIGFPILINLLKYFRYFIQKTIFRFIQKTPNNKTWVFTLSSKVNLVTTLCILIISTIILFFEEYYQTLAPHKGFGKLISAIFLSTTPRTAGFNHIDFTELHFSSTLIIIFLMWIGASPAGTGGGIKTSTFAIAVVNFLNIARGKTKIEIYKRELSPVNVQKAFAVMTLSFLVIGLGIFLMTRFDSHLHLINVAFEAFSAYSTVGLSRNTTPYLSSESKIVVISMMFIGRVSMITILMAFFKKTTSENYRYPTDEILI